MNNTIPIKKQLYKIEKKLDGNYADRFDCC